MEQPASIAYASDLADEALLLCILAEPDAAQHARLCELAADAGLDWEHFWRLALAQEIVPLVARTLTSSPLADRVPSHVLADARLARTRMTAHNLALHGELQRVGKHLQADGIPVTPLKGTHLTERLYRSLGDRRTEDVDILVPERQLRKATASLERIGYRSATEVFHENSEHGFHVTLFRRNATVDYLIELHWKLSHPRFVSIGYEDLWQRLLSPATGDGPFHSLSNEDLLLYLAFHLFKHELVLRRLADIDRLLRAAGSTIDWDTVVARAERWQVTAALYFAIQLSRQFFQTPAPEAVLARLRPAGWRRGLMKVLYNPRAVLHPPAAMTRRYTCSRLIYCLTLSPLHRVLAGYMTYVFLPPTRRRPGPLGATLDLSGRLSSGVGRTVLGVAGALVER